MFSHIDTINPHVGTTMGELRDSTAFRCNVLRSSGCTLIIKRECDFKDDIKKDPELAQFMSDLVTSEPLNPRYGFFGGRTNAI